MNRREFLKGLGLLSVAPLLVKYDKEVKQDFEKHLGFNPTYEYGNAIRCPGSWDFKTAFENLTEELFKNARKYLPKGTPFEIVATSMDWGLQKSVAWHYHPRMVGKPVKIYKNIPYERGRYLLGRFEA